MGGRRSAPPGHAVGLLDERDAEALRERDLGDRHEVGRGHPSAGAVAEHQRGHRLVGRMQVGAGGAVRRVDLDRRHLAGSLRGGRLRRTARPAAAVARAGCAGPRPASVAAARTSSPLLLGGPARGGLAEWTAPRLSTGRRPRGLGLRGAPCLRHHRFHCLECESCVHARHSPGAAGAGQWGLLVNRGAASRTSSGRPHFARKTGLSQRNECHETATLGEFGPQPTGPGASTSTSGRKACRPQHLRPAASTRDAGGRTWAGPPALDARRHPGVRGHGARGREDPGRLGDRGGGHGHRPGVRADASRRRRQRHGAGDRRPDRLQLLRLHGAEGAARHTASPRPDEPPAVPRHVEPEHAGDLPDHRVRPAFRDPPLAEIGVERQRARERRQDD